MSKTEETPAKGGNGFLKLALEVGPLGAFFLAYNKGAEIGAWAGFPDAKPIFVATAVFMIVMSVAVVASRLLTGKVAVMPLVTLAVVLVFGGLTLFLQDATFIKMKPTIVNLLFGGALFGGLAFGKLFLKVVFEDGFDITEEGWRVLTIRWGLFFLAMAALNELVWRNFSEDSWVQFKTWGVLPLTLIFALLQARVLFRYANPENSPENG